MLWNGAAIILENILMNHKKIQLDLKQVPAGLFEVAVGAMLLM